MGKAEKNGKERLGELCDEGRQCREKMLALLRPSREWETMEEGVWSERSVLDMVVREIFTPGL